MPPFSGGAALPASLRPRGGVKGKGSKAERERRQQLRAREPAGGAGAHGAPAPAYPLPAPKPSLHGAPGALADAAARVFVASGGPAPAAFGREASISAEDVGIRDRAAISAPTVEDVQGVAAASDPLALGGDCSCSGCGVPLQTHAPNHLGYFIPASEREAARRVSAGAGEVPANEAPVLPSPLPLSSKCQRCYQITHYGRLVPAAVEPTYFSLYLEMLRGRDALVRAMFAVDCLPSSSAVA
jgi:hypothetical protein